MSDRRDIPAVDALLQTRQAAEMVAQYGRPLTLEAIRVTLDELREELKEGKTVPERSVILTRIQKHLEDWLEPTLIPVINATGVILHTNLGRAPLSRAALQAMTNLAGGYSTLEYDLEKGARGSRELHAEALLTRLTGSEAALVVNNNAAAVLLALHRSGLPQAGDHLTLPAGGNRRRISGSGSDGSIRGQAGGGWHHE